VEDSLLSRCTSIGVLRLRRFRPMVIACVVLGCCLQSQQVAGSRPMRARNLYNAADRRFQQWLNQDVVYIITPEERSTFLTLTTAEEREEFIEQFWARRSPDPDSLENYYEDEQYRRIAFANEHFATDVPGWKTDRGRMYIVWGPPDQLESQPNGIRCSASGLERTSPPSEVWRYRYIEGIGEHVEIAFVYRHKRGDYVLTADPCRNSTQATRLSGSPFEHPGRVRVPETLLHIGPVQTPQVKFRDLEALLMDRIVRDEISVDHEQDFFYATDDTTLTLITVRVPEIVPSAENSVTSPAAVNLFGRITSISGRVVASFEDILPNGVSPMGVPRTLFDRPAFQQILPLVPGPYRLDLAVKAVATNAVTTSRSKLVVPEFHELSASSLVLADAIASPPTSDIVFRGEFLGAHRILPNSNREFRSEQPINLFWQVYGLRVDGRQHRNRASFTLSITKGGHEIWKETETGDELKQYGSEITIERALPPGKLRVGQYKVEIRVLDGITGQRLQRAVSFSVK
jgi:GWxTD domain-containing protein